MPNNRLTEADATQATKAAELVAGFYCPFCSGPSRKVSMSPPLFQDDGSNVMVCDAHCNACDHDWQVTYFFGIVLATEENV